MVSLVDRQVLVVEDSLPYLEDSPVPPQPLSCPAPAYHSTVQPSVLQHQARP